MPVSRSSRKAIAAVAAGLGVVGAVALSPGVATAQTGHSGRTATAVKTTKTSKAVKTSKAARAAAVMAPAGSVFGKTSLWKRQVGKDGVAANSPAMVALLASDVSTRYGGNAAFNVFDYDTSYYSVSPGTKKVNVSFTDCQGKGATPSGLTGPNGQFTGVPIPVGATPAAGTDGVLTISEPATDQMWELWRASHTSAGWSACWGGRLDHVSKNSGGFANGFGVSASGLALAGGMVGIADVEKKVVTHAVALAIPDPARTFVAPAHRGDGWNSDPAAIPEGTRLRLDPKLNVASLHLTPIATVIAKAAQTYGFIVTDTSGAVSVSAESGSAVQAVTGVNPWLGLLGGSADYNVLAGFPWSHLQVLSSHR